MQLEAPVTNDDPPTQTGFNSILVQLEVQQSGATLSCQPSFQFHIGAIRSRIARDIERAKESFNSILVQLEADIYHRSAITTNGFNSILVQLEGHTLKLTVRRGLCFNSILVQLEVTLICGSRGRCAVSIPYWCN